MKKVPVIFDTDIGSDIDDMWALGMLLNCPELDLKLITTSVGDTEARAKITAKFLEMIDRTDIPIGIGPSVGETPLYQSQWIERYDFSEYPGKIYKNGTRALIDTIMQSSQKVKVVSVTPLTTIEEALNLEPEIVKNSEFIGMHGSIDYPQKNYPENNVVRWPKGLEKVLNSGWKKTITPLDTCGKVILDDKRYEKFVNRHSKLTDTIMDAYINWFPVQNWIDLKKINPEKCSSILYDTVAVYLAISEEYVNIQPLPIRVSHNGQTFIDDINGYMTRVALSWKNIELYNDFLLERLTL